MIFPKIPTDPKSIDTLEKIYLLGRKMCEDGARKGERELAVAGTFLIALSSSPLVDDIAYFCIHKRLADLSAEFGDWYNEEIVGKSKDKNYIPITTQELDKQAGSLSPYFDKIQSTLSVVNGLAKNNPNWQPINTLLWGLFCAMFDRIRMEKFLKDAKIAIESLPEDRKKLEDDIRKSLNN